MISWNEKRVVFIFNRLGPYQKARLKALSPHIPIIGIEVSGKSETYFWENSFDCQFEHYTLTKGNEAHFYKAKSVIACLNKLKPTHVFIPGWAASFARAAIGWCLYHNAQAILMSDNWITTRHLNHPIEILKRSLLSLFSGALVAGSPHLQYLVAMGMSQNRIKLGYDVVDNEHFSSNAEIARKDRKIISEKYVLPDKYFIALGRFLPVKNLLKLIEAYQLYLKKYEGNPISLLLIGKGPMKGLLEEYINVNNLAQLVFIKDWVGYKELPFYYALSQGLIIPSIAETWGLVVNEAMASGIPVLVSKNCGCSVDLVDNGKNGFLFDPFDVTELAELMIKLSKPEMKRAELGNCGRKTIQTWSPALFAESVLELLSNETYTVLRKRPVRYFCSLILWLSAFVDVGDRHYRL